ncbi:MAG: S1 family peptidase [Anaerolineae bacterium]|jgi:hypothetical protein|nr:S1 family peptidase [Anaerolineae bacterium]
MTEIQNLLQAQAANEAQLLAKQNVIGVAVGYKESGGVVTDELAVIALVEEKKPVAQLAPDELVPKQVNGVRTDVYEVGKLRALQNLPKDRFRPTIPAGVSAGHHRVTAGTLGAIVKDRVTGALLLLSNNHVFANNNEAQVNDPILQPAPMDGGQNPLDIVARLERFAPLRFIEDAAQQGPAPIQQPTEQPAGCNIVSIFVMITNLIAGLTGSNVRATVTPSAAASAAGATIMQAIPKSLAAQAFTPDNALDAALARPQSPSMFTNEILGIGPIYNTAAPTLNMTVRKSGRTTGVTQGKVTLLNATINITYDTSRGERTARFTGQVLTEAMSQGGDSGSLVVDETGRNAVGLLFAGSPVASVFTPIDVVMAALDIVF